MKLNKIFYINLYYRKDRLFFCENQLKNLDIEYERIDAVQDRDGRVGCTKSHLKILEYIKNIQYDGYYLILEDDFFFSTDINFTECIEKMIQYNSPIFCLSYTYEKKSKVDDSYIRIHKSFSTCAYIIHTSFLSTLIENFQDALEKKKPIDVHWNQLQEKYFFIGYKKPLILQLPTFSNITNQDTFYQNHSYLYLEPNQKSLGHFLFEFLICLDLCIRFKKFLFIKNWNIYEPYFTMSFYPPKKLSRKKEERINSVFSSISLEPSKNYVLKEGFSFEILTIPFQNISYFLNFPSPTLQYKISIGILFFFHSSNQYTNLIYQNYFKETCKGIIKKYKNYQIDIYTDNFEKCSSYWKSFKNIKIYKKNPFETLYSLSIYEILILGNNSLSWWCGYLNKNPNKQLYFPKEWYSIRKPNPYPVLKNEVLISLYPITLILFNEKIPSFLLNKPYPILIYTLSNQTYENTFNIQIRKINIDHCICKSIFSNKKDIYNAEKIRLLYECMQENPFQTKFFGFLPISYFPYFYTHLRKLHLEKINILSISNSCVGMIGTQSSITKIYHEYYNYLLKYKNNIQNYPSIFSKYQLLTTQNHNYILYIFFILMIILLFYFII